ncbi:DNA polymerase III subunit epsilon, partial [Pseudoxanthomonas sp. SGD-10]
MEAKKRYAIVDIETTGGYAANSRITEIAVFVHNGVQIEEEYHTLINPGQAIPYHIQKLTGISDEMVAEAPSFDAVAHKVFKLLQDKVFVAHNVGFD